MDKSEITQRATLEQVEKTTGIPEPLLDIEPLPSFLEQVYEWFWEISSQRTVGMALDPITWRDLHAWSELTGIRLRQWEIKAILGIDAAYRKSLTPAPRKEVKK